MLKLPAGSGNQQVLPFAVPGDPGDWVTGGGLSDPTWVAVDSAGDIYVTDTSRVLKMPTPG